MFADLLLLSAFALVAFFVRGLTGAASSIVFNALLAVSIPLGLSGGLSLLDGLYWMALANVLASALLVALLARSLRLEPLTFLLLAGLLPTTVVFALLLPQVELGSLQLLMGIAIVGAGAYLARGDTAGATPSRRALFLALPAGAGAGVLSGLFGMGGPVLMLFLGPTSENPADFRSRFTVIAAATNVVRLVPLAWQGAYHVAQLQVFVATVPAIVVGLAAGFWAHRFVRPRPFRVGLGALVSLAGIAALLETLID